MSTTDTSMDVAETMQERLRQSSTQHPALARLQATLNGQTPPDQVITSYDRMHHRHNRSQPTDGTTVLLLPGQDRVQVQSGV